MEPDLFHINNDYKEKQRLKNVQEYQKKFFNKICKNKKNRRK
ncbi:hypothetical protein [uncultured Clostridium sp.]|nr:hypothetical protein [uncultured Clostridium sp.]